MSSHFSHCQNQNPLCLIHSCPLCWLSAVTRLLSHLLPRLSPQSLWAALTCLTLYTCSSCLNALVPRWHRRLCSQVSFPVEPPDAYSAALTLFPTFFLLLCAQTRVVVSLLPLWKGSICMGREVVGQKLFQACLFVARNCLWDGRVQMSEFEFYYTWDYLCLNFEIQSLG